MRCSSCEPLLDAYVEGILMPAARARLEAHLTECCRCSALLEELRVIDALLLAPRRLEPAPNFTFAVMAEVRTLPPPVVHNVSPLPMFGAYLAFAWLAIAMWFLMGGTASQATLAYGEQTLARLGSALAALVGSGANLFGHATVGVGAAMGLILVLDIMLAAGLAVGVVAVRSRRVERLSGTSEVSL